MYSQLLLGKSLAETLNRFPLGMYQSTSPTSNKGLFPPLPHNVEKYRYMCPEHAIFITIIQV